MDPNVVPVVGLGAAAFWISLAAVLIAGKWFNSKREAQRQEVLLRLMEKTGRIDEEQLKLLLPPQHPLPVQWFTPPPPGNGRRMMRVFGTLAMSVAVGLAVCFVFLNVFFDTFAVQQASAGAFGTAIVLGFLGAGLFIAARFAPPPPDGREVP